MKNILKMRKIPLLLLTIVATARAIPFVQNLYKKLEPEQNITGTIVEEHKGVSHIECSTKCCGIKNCSAYLYNVTRPGNCTLIKKNCTDTSGQVFQQDDKSLIFEKVKPVDAPGWTGPRAVFRHSFDDAEGLTLMEGTGPVDFVSLVCGQVNNTLTLNHTKSQWVDLGIHTEACMTVPDTCGAAGGAISLWVNVIDCDNGDGIISSHEADKTGFVIYCTSSFFVTSVRLPDGNFNAYCSKPSGWTHVVLNFIGPNDGQGSRLFYNGDKVANDTSKSSSLKSAGDGRIVVGRYYTDQDRRYASVQIDELIYFNKTLRTTDIELLYNTV